MCRRLPPVRSMSGGRRDESGRVEEEDAFKTAAAILSQGGRRWGDCDGKEEKVEEDDNGVTVAASGGVGRQNGGLDESSTVPTRRREAR
jgi:hypothetical protein